MKLTKFQREAFVRAAMQDVPTVDYSDQARKLVCAELDDLCEKALGITRKKLAESGWGETMWIGMPRHLDNFYAVRPESYTTSNALQEKLTELSELAGAQKAQYDELESKLAAVAASCTTLKALKAALPEFEKYMPEDTPAATRNMPAVANVVADFVKAGWPKGVTP